MMLKNVKSIPLIFLILIFSININAQSQLWLSGKPPKGVSKRVKPSGMQKYYAYRAERGKQKFVLWIREGENSLSENYSHQINEHKSLFAFGPEREVIPFEESINDLGHIITYDFETEGFHNIYYQDYKVIDSILIISSSKAERLSHQCRYGHKAQNIRLDKNIYPEFIDFELVRERIHFEDFHTIIQAGDQLQFKAMLKGGLLREFDIQISTATGWENTIRSTENGLAEFQLINDYFSDLKDIEKKKTSHLLVSTKHQIDSVGIYENQQFNKVLYTTNLEVEYIPTVDIYSSKVWGLIIFFGSLVALILAVIYLRKRRTSRYGRVI